VNYVYYGLKESILVTVDDLFLTGSYLYALPEVINRKKANKENGRINHAKPSLIGIWQISYTAGAKVNACCGRGRMVPPLFI
jgi:hypothetical protein